MIRTLFQIRIKQFFRIINSIGLPLLLVAMLALCGVCFQFLETLFSLPSWSVIPLVFFSFLYLHLYRKDKQFLFDIAATKTHATTAMALEYAILLMPVMLFQCVHSNFFIALGLLLVSGVVVSLPSFAFKGLKPRPLSFGFIPISLYEIRITLERYFFAFLLFWITSFLGVAHVAFFLVSLLFALTILISSYAYNEPLEVLGDNPHLLDEKLAIHVAFSLLLFMPQLFLTIFCNSAHLLIIGYGVFYYICIICLAIVYKYANYDPLRSVTLNASLIGVCMVLGLMPGLIVGSVFLLIYYYIKAKQNLNYYIC